MSGDGQLMNVIVAPVISEKSTASADQQRTAVFRVLPDANKRDIKRAVEKMFDVKVVSVRVTTMRGKTVYRLRHAGRRASWKKAYVRLGDGDDINFAELQ